MIDVIHEIVESLAQEIHHSVAVDDPGLRLLASSTHFEDVDMARLGSLVGRRVSGPARDYVMESGAQSWRSMTRLPANPLVGLDSDRIGFPLRSKFELLGFMWLMDDGKLTDDDVKAAAETAQEIEDLLVRKSQSVVSVDLEIESLVLALLSPDTSYRSAASRDMTDLGLFQHALHFSTYVVRVDDDGNRRKNDHVADVARRALAQATQSRSRESYAYAAAAEQSILILGHRTPPTDHELSSFAVSVHAEIAHLDVGISAKATVGIGDPVKQLNEIQQAFDQAAVAALVAGRKGQAVATWKNHPLDALLNVVTVSELQATDVPQQLRTLEEQSAELLAIVENYLDNAGNVGQTAEDLHLHRTTVYYRLGRFRELTGLDLDKGEVRLLIHLWFRLREHLTLV